MKDTKQQWFKDAKFGLFVHWGLYSILAGEYKGEKTDRIAEWIMNYLNIPAEEYEKLAEQFNPVNFDADTLVRSASEWGMKYIVITAKHHEGFAMYDSKCNAYNVMNTPYGKDILKELKAACDKYGMRLGFYYSQAQDWHDPNGLMYLKDNSHKDYQHYLDTKVKPQLTELLTQYGDIALIWFDTPMESTLKQSQELVDLVKSIQPNCIVSGRIGNDLGEYMTTGDNFIPRLPYEGDWELPATLNDTWGFNKDDHNWKSPESILRILLKVVSRGGNYLLNVGPDSLGNVPQESMDILGEVGQYVRKNADAIFETQRVSFYPYELDWAEFTQKSHKLFVHVFEPKKRVDILNIANHIKRAYIVEDGKECEFTASLACEQVGLVEVHIPEDRQEKSYYCVCLELEEEAPVFEPLR